MVAIPQPGPVNGWQGLRCATGSGSSSARVSLGSPVGTTSGVQVQKMPPCIAESDTCSAATADGRGCRQQTIVGLGDPVMDMLVHVDDQKLGDLGLATGGCVPVSEGQMAALIQALRTTAGSPRYTWIWMASVAVLEFCCILVIQIKQGAGMLHSLCIYSL